MKQSELGFNDYFKCALKFSMITLALTMAATQAFASAFISDGSLTSRPFGHVAYCKSNPGECRGGSRLKAQAIKPDRMAGGRWETLKKVNISVNNSIRPASDQENTGVSDLWSAFAKTGDCEDYALTKQRKLLSAGFKSANLRLAMVRIPSGTAHLVLVVRTDKGDMVLDNLKTDIKLWKQTGYRFVKIQAKGGSSDWVSIGN